MYEDCQVVLSSMGMDTANSNDNIGNSNMNMNNMFSSDSSAQWFSSPPNMNNTNSFNFMPTNNLLMPPLSFHHSSYPPIDILATLKEESDQFKLGKLVDDQMEMSGSGSDQIEALSASDALDINNNNNNNTDQNQKRQSRKKRYHRHTAHQIQEMEAVFKECLHPDDKQRMRLSQDLGLKPSQIKFWFQNRRTQMKAQHDRQDNVMLRQENDSLMNENYRLQAALRNIECPNCGGPAMLSELGFDEQQLRIENARLKEELDRVCNLVSNYSNRPLQSLRQTSSVLTPSLDLEMGMFSRHFQESTMENCSEMAPPPSPPPHHHHHFNDGEILILEEEKQLALELAMSSVDELLKMCRIDEPLWCQCKSSGEEVLNVLEYSKMFPWMMTSNESTKQNSSATMRTEATRESSVVIMNSITLVDAFMDCMKWVDLFPSVVSNARTIQVVSSGVSGNANGLIQLMHAEFQFLSPLVPTREVYFLRYCQQDADEGNWVIVDFPIDNFRHNIQSLHLLRYKRRPSGCVIQDMPNGYSRVTWVEHSEIEEMPVHQIFNNIVNNGLAFGAKRWLNVLQRQCERLASLMARNIPDLGVIPSLEARKNLMKLAQRMIKTFCINISTSNGQSWTALSDSSDDTLRITTRNIIEPGQPTGVILCAVSTTWLPQSQLQVFDFLRDEHKRAQIDALSNGNSFQEVAHIANGSHPGNCISLLRINVASNSSQNIELMLQESCIDQSGCLIVHANVDVDSIQLAMSGEEPSCIPLLPIGFIINPVKPITSSNSTSHGTKSNSFGCLLTIGLQVVASSLPSTELSLSSITAINNHICNMVHQISIALGKSSSNEVAAHDASSSGGGGGAADDD